MGSTNNDALGFQIALLAVRKVQSQQESCKLIFQMVYSVHKLFSPKKIFLRLQFQRSVYTGHEGCNLSCNQKKKFFLGSFK